MIFCRDVADAQTLARLVSELAVARQVQQTQQVRPVMLVHDYMGDTERTAAFSRFRSHTASAQAPLPPVLVCTYSVAARGLDLPDVRHVILYDVPTDIAMFVHTAGRTARRGQEGLVTCLCRTGAGDFGRYKHLHALQDAPPLHFRRSHAAAGAS